MGQSHSFLSLANAHREGDSVPPQFQPKQLLASLEQKPSLIVRKSFTQHHTIWHEAAEKGFTKALEALAQFVVSNSRDLMHCAFITSKSLNRPCNTHDLLRLLVNQGNGKGQTPLMYAAYNKHPEAVSLLLSLGADPWLTDRCGNKTALHYAAMAGSAPCVQALMDGLHDSQRVVNGVRYIDVRTISGFCALHYAVDAGRGHVEALAALLACDPNVVLANVYPTYEFYLDCAVLTTPLHLAAQRGCDGAAEELLKFYVARRDSGELHDPRLVPDSLGNLPFQVALTRKHTQLADLLHPGTDLSSRWDPDSLPSLGVPTLKLLAGAALRAKLLHEAHAVSVVSAEAKVEGMAGPRATSGLQEAGGQRASCSSSGGRALAPAPACPSSSCQAVLGLADNADECGGDDDDDNVCGVCLDELPDAAMVGCGHGLCSRCALGVACHVRDQPALCPFCRGAIKAFQPISR